MPFNTDIRAGTVKVEFNISVIHDILSDFIQDHYKECWDYLDVDEGSKFWFYVYQLENEYAGYCNTLQNTPNLLDWLMDNYNNIRSWEDVIEDVVKCSKQLHKDNMEDVFKDIVEWEKRYGFPDSDYNTHKEMAMADGEYSEQEYDTIAIEAFRDAMFNPQIVE